MSRALLQVENLSVQFAGRRRWFGARAAPFQALDEVSFSVAPHEIVGLVGESGSGKSTLARALLRLVAPSAGSVQFDGADLRALDAAALKQVRRRMQMIFQDPYASLNPRMSVGANIAEGLVVHAEGSHRARAQTVAALLQQVGLQPGSAGLYPHQFSGGQRQRIGIARALALQPSLIVADEPVSALDLSIQAQILNLLLEQQEQRGLALLFIGHDLSVIRHFCERILVLYRGRIVESGPTETIFGDPRHPYTRALIDSAPVSHPSGRAARRAAERPVNGGDTSVPLDRAGCSFGPRCPYALPACAAAVPALRSLGPAHAAACIRDDLPAR